MKSESSNDERNYLKYFNNNTNDCNNTNISNDTNVNNNTNDGNDDIYDGQIRDKISYIRVILCRLGDIVTKNDREKIKKELHEIQNKKNLSNEEKRKDL